jgi:hypothetical protein
MAGVLLQPYVIVSSYLFHIYIHSSLHSYGALTEPLHQIFESFCLGMVVPVSDLHGI